MRIALLSDIHANIQALDACLAHARAQQAQRFVFLGDMVGYGADPSPVINRIMLLTEEGALALLGNHDAMALTPPAEMKTVGDSTAAWTHRQLSDAQRQWLSSLPLTLQQDQTLFVHASADNPERWRYVYDARAAAASLDAAAQEWAGVHYVFGGHVHLQTLYYRGVGDGLMPFMPQSGVAVPVPRHRPTLGGQDWALRDTEDGPVWRVCALTSPMANCSTESSCGGTLDAVPRVKLPNPSFR